MNKRHEHDATGPKIVEMIGDHKIGANGSCVACGCSATAVRAFGWRCKGVAASRSAKPPESAVFREPSPLVFECDTCGALPGEPCRVRDRNGARQPTQTHASRFDAVMREMNRQASYERERQAAWRHAHAEHQPSPPPRHQPSPPPRKGDPWTLAWDIAKAVFAVGILVLSAIDKRNQQKK